MELITDHKKNKKLDFDIVYEAYAGYVKQLAYRFTSNVQSAEDITQEVFVKVWKSLSDFNNESQLKTWIYRITINLCIDEQRKSKRFGVFTELKSWLGIDLKTPENILSVTEQFEWLMLLSKQLPHKQYKVFVLRDLQDLDMHEVAEILEMTTEQIKSNLYYARKFLRTELKKLEE